MSTRACVAVMDVDGTVSSIYNHWDGYESFLGATLRDHYNTPEKVNELIALGDVSVLMPTLEESVFYHRDRKESRARTVARKFAGVEEWRMDMYFSYMYLFRDGVWYVYVDGERVKKL